MELLDPRRGELAHIVQVAEPDRLGRTRRRARGHQVVLEAVVAERAFLREPAVRVEPDDVVGAGRDAVPASVTDVRLDVDRVELGPDDGVGRAHVHAARMGAMLADVAHHRPRDATRRRGARLLDELDVAPVLPVELTRVVEAVPEFRRVARELIPLLAGDLARLAPDADGHVREKPNRFRHGDSPYPIPIIFAVIFTMPRSCAYRSSGSAANSSTIGTASGSFRRSTVRR